MRTRSRLFPVLLFLGWLAAPAMAGTLDAATAMVKDTAERILSALEARRAEIEAHPHLINDLVNEIVAPAFDFESITRGALGRAWRKATPEQRKALVQEFRQLLIRTYAKALLNYSGQEIRYLRPIPGSRPGRLLVRTRVAEPGAAPIPIDYSLHQKHGAWRVYDVKVDGVSLVSNYRSSFRTEIRRGGIDHLIHRLRERNQEGAHG